MACQWQTAASVWLEDETTGHFDLATHAGLGQVDWRAHAHPARVHEVASWLGAALPTVCQCAPVFPPDFAFCPNCGAPLRQPAMETAGHAWHGPFHDAALPEHVPKGVGMSALSLARRLRPPTQNRPDVSLPAPPAAPCVFFSSHTGFAASRLLALAYRQNVLQYYNPDSADWQILSAQGAADLGFTVSEYDCLPPLTQDAGALAVIPTAQGLMQLHINPLGPSFQLRPLTTLPVLAAPGRVFDELACLVLHEGQVGLWHLPCAAPGQASDRGTAAQVLPCPVPGTVHGGWSRPVAYQGRLIWLHAQGQLLWQSGMAPKWLPWPDGWQSRHSVCQPMQSLDGRLWQLGQTLAGYAFLELGHEQPQIEDTDGARMGFGRVVFRLGHPVNGEPWGSFTVENEKDHGALVWPLLGCYDQDKRQQGVLVARLPDYVGTIDQLLIHRDSRDCKLEWVGEQHLTLDRLQLARPWELSCLVHDHTLWMHHPDWRHLRGWRLQEGA